MERRNPVEYLSQKFSTSQLLADLRFAAGPKPGEAMPDFDLETVSGERVRKSDYVGTRPMLLVMGSYTCPMTSAAGPVLKSLHEEFGRDIGFLMLYTREAHPGELYPQPTTLGQKTEHARQYGERDGITYPIAIDDIDGTLHRALDLKSNAVYLMGVDGTVAYRAIWAGGSGGSLRRALRAVLQGRRLRQSQAHGVAMLRGLGSTYEILNLAGRQAKLDTLRGAPPMYLMASVARIFRPLPPLGRGLAALATIMLPVVVLIGIAAQAIA